MNSEPYTHLTMVCGSLSSTSVPLFVIRCLFALFCVCPADCDGVWRRWVEAGTVAFVWGAGERTRGVVGR